MRLSKQHGTHRVLMNITPLIDIVFLLIIFFVTVSQITEVNEEKLELPRLQGDNDQSPVSIIVNINADAQIFVSGKQRSVAETVLIVGNELTRVGNEPSLIRILMRNDRQTSSGVFNELLRQFKQMEITQVRVGVEVDQ